MHIGRKITVLQTLKWTSKNILIFATLTTILVILYELLDFKWMTIPFLPISLIGIAVAFTIGFKNNTAYDRLWEARKSWGSIVNESRTWAIQSLNYPLSNETEKKKLIDRHIAWLTTLRFQIRKSQSWEHNDLESNKKRDFFQIEEYNGNLDELIKGLIDDNEWEEIKNCRNPAAQLLTNQSNHLCELEKKGELPSRKQIEMMRTIHELFLAQGQSERIKTFPFPRQYASMSLYFVWIFIFLLPFGMMNEFAKAGQYFVWLTIPFCVLVSWVFHTLERIGDFSENPFEGSPNDVPITTISKGIEADLRQMIDRKEESEKIVVKRNVQF